jgi:hypothetical protein
MIWSPLSNLLLYGKTARIADAKAEGVTIGLGPDWSPSGSKNLLGELKIARLVAAHAGDTFSDFDVLATATRNAAAILRWDTELGTLEAGKRADVFVVAGDGGDGHAHLFTRNERDVELVVINGVPRYGASQAMRRLLGAAASDAESVTIAGRARLVYLEQPSGDPDVGRLTLEEATDLLTDGLRRLPKLAEDLLQLSALDLLEAATPAETPVFLVLDHDDLVGADLRPHLPDASGAPTAEPSPAELAELATPLPDLLEPLELDPLTVVGDNDFVESLADQRNLPDFVAEAVPGLY